VHIAMKAMAATKEWLATTRRWAALVIPMTTPLRRDRGPCSHPLDARRTEQPKDRKPRSTRNQPRWEGDKWRMHRA